MSDTPNKLVDIHQRQPDCGGNRHYDYISLEDFDAAEITLKNKKTWQSLTTNEIVVLRSKAKKLGINQDIVDHSDRLDLLWVTGYQGPMMKLAYMSNDPASWDFWSYLK